MNIGIIGSGHVGGTLGRRWARGGHSVIFSSRHPESEEMKQLVAAVGGSARSAGVADAVAASEVLLLATPYEAAHDALRSAGDLGNRVLIDATNPLLEDLSGLSVGRTTSAAEQVALWAQGGRVVKAFNTVGYKVMENPEFGDAKAVLPYCGEDEEAKRAVHGLAAELGFDPVDMGPLAGARSSEPFALLWITLAYGRGMGPGIAFQLLKRG
jgi:8-hydroxy-5-deazaflavin:NADPH oxidoreductase